MKKVLLLLADGFETYEAAVFIDVIGWNLIDGDQTTKLFSCGLDKELSASFEQKFVVDYLIREIDVNDFDALAIPGDLRNTISTKMPTTNLSWKLSGSLIRLTKLSLLSV